MTLTANRTHLDSALLALTEIFGVAPVNVTGELMAEIRKIADTHGIPWQVVLRADRPDAAPRDAANLRRLAVQAGKAVEERLAKDPEPLLLVDAEPLARYGRLGELESLADPATVRPAARWLLVAASGQGQLPRLDSAPAPTTSGWLHLPSAWIDQVLAELTRSAS